MPYRLLALDLDGTVFERDLVIPAAVVRAIDAAHARGVHVTIATGRMFGATLPIAEQLHIIDPLICYQGALIRHPLTGEIYDYVGMPGPPAAEAIELLLAAGIFVIAYIDERLCVAERRPELDLYLRWHPEGAEVVVAPDLAAMVGASPPTKLLFIAEPPIVDREIARLAVRFAGRLSVVRSHMLFGELTAQGINKGTALAALAAHLAIPREQVIAIGDQENDLPMITWAGLGLAVGNAIPEVRRVADAVIPSVGEAGVAWAIDHYVLGGAEGAQ